MDTLTVLFTQMPYLLVWAIALAMGLVFKIDLKTDANEFDIAHETITAIFQALVIMTFCTLIILKGAGFFIRPVWEIITVLIAGNAIALAMPVHYYLQARSEQIRGASHPLSFVPVSNPKGYYTERNGNRWYREPLHANQELIGPPPPGSPWYKSMKHVFGEKDD